MLSTKYKDSCIILRAQIELYLPCKIAYVTELDAIYYNHDEPIIYNKHIYNVCMNQELMSTIKPPGIDELRCTEQVHEKFGRYKKSINNKSDIVFNIVNNAFNNVRTNLHIDGLRRAFKDVLPPDMIYEVAKHQPSQNMVIPNPIVNTFKTFKIQYKYKNKSRVSISFRIVNKTKRTEKCSIWTDIDETEA